MATPATSTAHPLLLARYPFLPEAGTWAQHAGPAVDDLLSKKVWGRARSRGRERVTAALDGEPVPRAGATNPDEALLEVLSYAVARMVVAAVGDEFLVRRLAVAEARAAKQALDGDTDGNVQAVAAALGVRCTWHDGTVRVRFTDYLVHASAIRALEWKLVNQVVDRGDVVLQRSAFTRLAQEAVRSRVESGLPPAVPAQVAEALKDAIAAAKARVLELRARSVEADFGEVAPELFPECMQNILKAIKGGVNVSHEGRFAIVAFMHTIGVDNDTIINDVFSSVPDFAKSITQYQVEHITGKKGVEAYTPPACQTLQTYGLCPFYGKPDPEWDRLCAQEWMTHPLKYYRTKLKDGRGAGTPAGPPDAPPAAPPSDPAPPRS